jgi:predicted dienelactone hydrolase
MKSGLLIAAAALAACGSRVELGWPVDQPGQHPIGYRLEQIAYPAPPQGEERFLRTAIWYPAAEARGINPKYLELERPNVFQGAPAAGEDLPVLVISHGHLGFAEIQGDLGEHFASHGFVVIAPDHTGDTFEDLAKPLTTEMYLWRIHDLAAAIAHLRGLPEGDPLYGRIGERILAAGHSLGGYTVLAAAGATFPNDPAACPTGPEKWCSTMTPEIGALFQAGLRIPELEAVIALAPGSTDVLGPGGVAAIEVPVLLATGRGDLQTKGEQYWQELTVSDRRWLELLQGGHHSFNFTCEVLPGFGRDDGCGPEAIPSADARRIVTAYALAFARRYLFDDASVSATLDVDGEVWPGALAHLR